MTSRLARLTLPFLLATCPGLAIAQQSASNSDEHPRMTSPSETRSQRDSSNWHQSTLFGGLRNVDHGGYGSLFVRGSALNDDPALFVGARGGWLIGHRLLVGIGGAGQTLSVGAPPAAELEYPDARNLEFGYGGAFIAYHFMPERLLHPMASVLMGAGGLALSNREMHAEEPDTREFTANGVFIVEPEAALEMNLLDILRLQVTLSYRQALGVDLPGLDNSDVSGLAGGVAMLFGSL